MFFLPVRVTSIISYYDTLLKIRKALFFYSTTSLSNCMSKNRQWVLFVRTCTLIKSPNEQNKRILQTSLNLAQFSLKLAFGKQASVSGCFIVGAPSLMQRILAAFSPLGSRGPNYVSAGRVPHYECRHWRCAQVNYELCLSATGSIVDGKSRLP